MPTKSDVDKKWIRLKDKLPVCGKLLWGYCVFYDRVHLCIHIGGRFRDDGLPFLRSQTDSGDDYSIEYWMPVDSPSPPNCKYMGDDNETI